ncbi:MAG: lipid-A-disaccharide synthase [Pseudomonadota bacterium]|nr:lipid-A-disaccharide synthase [Pseudomonadota bacterium]MDE3037984.1 lipid-A-disaccharide synthase [Pseudomonadota bacterium]
MTSPLKIYLIAGEASGDLLGARLMRALKSRSDRPIAFYGVGGDQMAAEGLASLFPFYELSMMGFIEILPYIFNLAARIQQTVDDIMAKQPDMVITIDSPGFNFRVAAKLRRENCRARLVHYVAPSVWAYKPKRAKKCAALFDHLLCLLPFEPPYFEKEGLSCTWVGHPVVAETEPGDGAGFREKYRIAENATLLALLPGSRKGEVKRHMPIFAKAVTLLAAECPNLALVIAVPKNVLPFAAAYFEGCPFHAVITAGEREKQDAIAAANAAIVKSGTVALEVSLARVPMVVAYRVNALSAWLFRRIQLTKFANLVNIIAGREIIPELLQELCAPIFIAGATAALLSDPRRRNMQQEESAAALAQLVPPGGRPSDLAAEAILRTHGKNNAA